MNSVTRDLTLPPPLPVDRTGMAVTGSRPTSEREPEPRFGRVPACPPPLRHPLRAAVWLLRIGVGLAAVVLLLSALAAVPLLNVLALGYLLDAEGRVARTGKLRHAVPLLGWAPRLGSIALGLAVWLWPLSLLAAYAADARLIDPASPVTRGLNRALSITAVLIGVQLCLALARGGSPGCFFRPLKNVLWLVRQLRSGGYGERAGATVREFVGGLRLAYHFGLGLRGLVGAMAWLVVPTALFAAADKTEGGPFLLTLLGAVLLMLVFGWLPFLQARFAAENRLRAMFEWRATRRLFAQAPLAWLTALAGVYALALPLYLSKIVLPPRDALLLLTPLFIISIYPARVLTGWAYHRATSRPRRAWFGGRWLCRLLLVPLLAGAVFLLFFTQFIGEHGKRVLFEHHAFLLPVPF